MESIPALLLSIILQSEVLNIEELRLAVIRVDCFHVLPSVSSLSLENDLFVESLVDVQVKLLVHALYLTIRCLPLFLDYFVNVRVGCQVDEVILSEV